jgi:hypothetical protein
MLQRPNYVGQLVEGLKRCCLRLRYRFVLVISF